MAANRQPVAKGGMWSTQTAPVSQETQQLLKGNLVEAMSYCNCHKTRNRPDHKKIKGLTCQFICACMPGSH